MSNLAKQFEVTLTENEVNVILNGLDMLTKSVGIINKDGSFSTGNSALIINTASSIIQQVTKQKVEDGTNNE